MYLDLPGVTTTDQMLDALSTHNSHFLPQNCRTTFRAPVEEHENTSLVSDQDGYLPLSAGLKYPALKDQACGLKHDRMATAALSRRGSSKDESPITVSPLCWHWPGVLNSYLFHCRGFSGKREHPLLTSAGVT